MTEDQAKAKQCPSDRAQPCAASGCMAWRWYDGLTPRETATGIRPKDKPEGEGWTLERKRETSSGTEFIWTRPRERRGFCGLAGVWAP